MMTRQMALVTRAVVAVTALGMAAGGVGCRPSEAGSDAAAPGSDAAIGTDAATGIDAAAAPDPAAAAALFWEAFHAQEYDRLAEVITALDAVYDADPTLPENTLLLAHANLWGVSELGRSPAPSPADAAMYALGALQYFQEAMALSPTDYRIHGWLGATLIGTGYFTGDMSLVMMGEALIDAGVAAFPEFNLFVRALILMGLPATDPEFAGAADALWETLDVCVGETVDRVDPDYSPYLGLETTTGPARVCWNGTKAPHNFEGFFLHMGDVLVKGGATPEPARRIYENAMLSPTYADWPFRTTLEDRLATLDARAALYADADPSNDPILIAATPTQCAACHATE